MFLKVRPKENKNLNGSETARTFVTFRTSIPTKDVLTVYILFSLHTNSSQERRMCTSRTPFRTLTVCWMTTWKKLKLKDICYVTVWPEIKLNIFILQINLTKMFHTTMRKKEKETKNKRKNKRNKKKRCQLKNKLSCWRQEFILVKQVRHGWYMEL